MSDITTILARMGQMEKELSTLRAAARTSQTPAGLDNATIKRRLLTDTYRFLNEVGMNSQELQHIEQVTVARALGDQAPMQLQVAANMGPALARTDEIASTLEAISRRLDGIENKETQSTTVASLKALATDKTKYPHLATAFAANPKLFENRVEGRKGTAEELAQTFEDESKEFAQAFGVKAIAQPASEANAETDEQVESMNDQSANTGGNDIDVPQLPTSKVGLFNDEENAKLKAEILRKYNLQ